MNDYRHLKFCLKEAEICLQFLSEDIDSIESINEDVAAQIEHLLKEVTRKLQESANILSIELRGGGNSCLSHKS